jgi:C_GCAxxG_C_C family probable redox protein
MVNFSSTFRCKEITMDEVERALERFSQGYNCAQAVFSAFTPGSGLPEEAALKIAASFGGGISRTGGECGAVTGALMALGLRSGNTDAQDKEAKEQDYLRAQAFLEAFRQRHGSVLCRGLLGEDISRPEGLQAARAQNLFKERCPALVRSAAEILARG